MQLERTGHWEDSTSVLRWEGVTLSDLQVALAATADKSRVKGRIQQTGSQGQKQAGNDGGRAG